MGERELGGARNGIVYLPTCLKGFLKKKKIPGVKSRAIFPASTNSKLLDEEVRTRKIWSLSLVYLMTQHL